MSTAKALLKILLGGFVAFQVLAIGQEWDFFASAWFGKSEPTPELSEAEREEAANAVYLTLSLMQHLYLSGGDPRFADRLPASEAVREEMLADVEYLGRNHRRQDPVLENLRVESVDLLGADRVEVRTRERWTIRTLPVVGGEEAEPPRFQEITGKYLVVRRGSGWKVEAWDFAGPDSTGPGAAGLDAAAPPPDRAEGSG